MSGTSLDGLDIAYVEFKLNQKWQFELKLCETIRYTEEWKIKLSNLHKKSKKKIQEIDLKYGLFIGKLVLVPITSPLHRLPILTKIGA